MDADEILITPEFIAAVNEAVEAQEAADAAARVPEPEHARLERERQVAEIQARHDKEAAERQAKLDAVKNALRDAGIEMSVGACGCCSSPWVTFIHDGEVILEDEERFEFDTRKKEDGEWTPTEH